MVATRQLTPEGLNWLTLATDPFHDTSLVPAGYPDLNTCNSIVQCYTSTTVVTAPASAGTGTWDAHVFMAPFTPPIQSNADVNLRQHNYNYAGSVLDTPVLANTATLSPGYNVITIPSGLNWTVAGLGATSTAQIVKIPNAAATGLFRMIGCGVEVVNTTPELYKGGSVTCYRAPSNRGDAQVGVLAAGVLTGRMLNSSLFELPPPTQSAAQLYPNSRTWAAEEGYYGIGTLSDAENPFVSSIQKTPMGWYAPSASDLLSVGYSPAFTYAPTTSNGQANPSHTTTSRVLPFDAHGCVFSGLSNVSTLQVTTKYFFERIPSVSEPEFLVLARPPSPFDSNALEIYSRSIAQLPVGCMVSENPLGEWFNDVLSTVAEWAPKVGGVFGPMGSVLGKGVGSGAQMWLDSRQTQPISLGQPLPKQTVRPAKALAQPAQMIASKNKRRRKKRAKKQ